MSEKNVLLLSLAIFNTRLMCPPGAGNGGFLNKFGDEVDVDEYELGRPAVPTRPPKSEQIQEEQRRLSRGKRLSIVVPDDGEPLPPYATIDRGRQGSVAVSLPGMAEESTVGEGEETGIYDNTLESNSGDDEYEEPSSHLYQRASVAGSSQKAPNLYERLEPQDEDFYVKPTRNPYEDVPEVPASARAASVGAATARAMSMIGDMVGDNDQQWGASKVVVQKEMDDLRRDLAVLESSYQNDLLEDVEVEVKGIMGRLRSRLSTWSSSSFVTPQALDSIIVANDLLESFNSQYNDFKKNLMEFNKLRNPSQLTKQSFMRDHSKIIEQAQELQKVYIEVQEAVLVLHKLTSALAADKNMLHYIKSLGNMKISSIEKVLPSTRILFAKQNLQRYNVSEDTKLAHLPPDLMLTVMRQITTAAPASFVLPPTKGSPMSWVKAGGPLVKALSKAVVNPYALAQVRLLLEGRRMDIDGLGRFVRAYNINSVGLVKNLNLDAQ